MSLYRGRRWWGSWTRTRRLGWQGIGLTDKYYYAMAFSGQFQVKQYGNVDFESDTFKALVPDAKVIMDIVINEHKGNTNSKGKIC